MIIYVKAVGDSDVLDARNLDALPTLGENLISKHQTTIPNQHSPILDGSNLREADDVISNDTKEVDHRPGSAQNMDDGEVMTNYTSDEKFDDSGHSSFHPHSANYFEETDPQDSRNPGVEPSVRNHGEHIQTDSGNPFSLPGLTATGSGYAFSFMQPSPFPVFNGVFPSGSTGLTPIPYNSVAGVKSPGYQSTIFGIAPTQLFETGPSSSNPQTITSP